MSRDTSEFFESLHTCCPKHVGFWLGSAISYFSPSCCASVGQIKYSYVLEPLREILLPHKYGSGETIPEAIKLIEAMLDTNTQLGKEVQSLPFEQFMNCLDGASPKVALDIVSLACQGAAFRSPGVGPNANHVWFVEAASYLLTTKLCKEVTIFTTNYDTFLEDALHQVFPGVARPKADCELPTWEARLPHGLLRILKVHGCLSKPGSLVYTSGHWVRFLLKDTWFPQLEQPDALLYAGYSFSDPHLRPLFEKWLKKNPPLLALSRRELPRAGLPTGADYLREEFLARTIGDNVFYCDLSNPGDHPIHALGNSIGCSPSPPPRIAGSFVPATKAAAIINILDKSQVIAFLSNIVDSCALGDADTMLDCYLLENPRRTKKTPQFIASYLLQLGHNDEYEAAIQKCAVFRERYGNYDEAKLITWGYESFARTIKHLTIESAVLAYSCLLCGKQVLTTPLFPVSEEWTFAASFFTHRKLHFETKSLLFQILAPDRKLLEEASSHPILGCIIAADELKRAVELVQELGKASAAEKERANLYGFTQLEDLRAQLLIVAAVSASDQMEKKESAERAWKAALLVRDIYFSIGQINSVILAERTLGWACLANETCAVSFQTDWLNEAIKWFGFGLMRSLRCTDTSLRWKLGANLARLFLKDVLNGTAVEVVPSLDEACEELIKNGRGAHITSKMRIWNYVCSLYPSEESRCKLTDVLKFYGDLSKYPIFLPPDP